MLNKFAGVANAFKYLHTRALHHVDHVDPLLLSFPFGN